MRCAIPAACSLLGLFACSQEPPAAPPPVVVPSGGGGPEVVRRVELDLADATLADTARALANATGKPVAIEPAAQELASCVRITIVSPGSATADEVLAIVGRALEGSALSLEQSPDGAVVRRVPGAAPPASCSPPDDPPPGDRTADAERPAPRPALEGLRRTSPTTFLVTRAARDAAFADHGTWSRSARVVPQMENGAVVGLRLYGIRSGSLLAQLGLQNGDTLRTINGAEVSSPERALEAYARLRSASAYEVAIERRGAPVTLTYRVVDRLP